MIAGTRAFWTAGTQMSIKNLSNFAARRAVVHTGDMPAKTRFLTRSSLAAPKRCALFALQFQSILTSGIPR
jgi:hypothetical protein